VTGSTIDQRQALIQRFIGPSIPRLWCPPITHYTDVGHIDVARMASHWTAMVRHVGGFLVPGSTGEAWEMTPDEVAQLLDVALDLAVVLKTRVLVGVLRPEVTAVHQAIAETLEQVKRTTCKSDALEALCERHIAGFTVCAPTGAHLSQADIQTALESILDLGLPTALYQLPQVTQNEVSPAAFESIAARYPNLLLFKDTSGHDRVALSDRGRSGVFLVRGAEGDYAQWLEEGGGCYRGLLLSTANCFAAQLAEIVALGESGDRSGARLLSRRLSKVVTAVFDAVADIPEGNAFANANKAVDHFMAHGPGAAGIDPPMLHAGVRLPVGVIQAIGKVLYHGGFMPDRGYLA
jgi:dihydrodipicolinate synthase/N-acetylneuraminate lyase